MTLGEYLQTELGLTEEELESMSRTKDGRKLYTIDLGPVRFNNSAEDLKEGDIIRIGRMLLLKEDGILWSLS